MKAAAQIRDAFPADVQVRTAVVAAITPGVGLTLNLAGGTVVCGYLNSYTPQVGDVVQVLRFGASWFVLGEVMT